MAERRVVVVGGGISGLAAAYALAVSGTDIAVTLLEADHRLGGKISSTSFAGRAAVDEGADAFLARVPHAADLARQVGLDDTLVSPATQRAAIWMNRLHDIPGGLLLGMPVGIGGMARSRLLPVRAKLRAASEVVRRTTPVDNDSLGSFVRHRFGDVVHERLVDPLVGSIYAADTDRFSLAAVPQIAEVASRSRSVLLGTRSRPAGRVEGPVFLAPQQGMAAFVDAVGDAASAAGAELRLGTEVTELRRDGRGWMVNGIAADAVVLACPAAQAATLAGGYGLSAVATADVVLVTLAVPSSQWPHRLRGRSGYLVPKSEQQLVTAVSFASQKWSHLSDGATEVLRVSLGRDGLPVLHLDDEALARAAVDEVGRHLGVDLQPTEVRVSRWPGAFPQYRPHHGRWVGMVEASIPDGMVLCGASYHGIGIPACVRSGHDAAARALQRVAAMAQ
jgi:protoporphyrinogen/coproporphyrinogen III oxidase